MDASCFTSRSGATNINNTVYRFVMNGCIMYSWSYLLTILSRHTKSVPKVFNITTETTHLKGDVKEYLCSRVLRCGDDHCIVVGSLDVVDLFTVIQHSIDELPRLKQTTWCQRTHCYYNENILTCGYLSMSSGVMPKHGWRRKQQTFGTALPT